MHIDGFIFKNRRDAGRKLAKKLTHLATQRPIILALPRGGVPVAFEVAKALEAPLDVLIVRKIGAPGQEELAIGAVVNGPEPLVVLNSEIVQQIALDPAYLQLAVERQLAEIERRRQAYCGNRPPIPMANRNVIVIDDGIATGATMKAALRAVKRNHPARLLLAVPLASASAIAELAQECDEVICLNTPEPFGAVGAFYEEFNQTSDAEVVSLLDQTDRLLLQDDQEAGSGVSAN